MTKNVQLVDYLISTESNPIVQNLIPKSNNNKNVCGRPGYHTGVDGGEFSFIVKYIIVKGFDTFSETWECRLSLTTEASLRV